MARLPSGLDARRTRAEWSPDAVKRLILLHVQCGNRVRAVVQELSPEGRNDASDLGFYFTCYAVDRNF